MDLSENLKKQGAFIPGVKPGASTADYIDDVLARITLPGRHLPGRDRAHPDPRVQAARHSAQFGGTSVLIVVGVLLDTHRAGRAAPDAPEVRQLHEDRAGSSSGAGSSGSCRLGLATPAYRGKRQRTVGLPSPIRPSLGLALDRKDARRMDILLIGPPGAGKGTQGALLAEALGLPKFATGDLLRDAVSRGTPLGLQAKAVMEAGQLVERRPHPRRRPRGARQARRRRDGVIFDGVVRTIPQAEGMDRAAGRAGAPELDHVLFFDVTDDEILGRHRAAPRHREPGRRRSRRGGHAARRPIATRPRRCWPGTSSGAAVHRIAGGRHRRRRSPPGCARRWRCMVVITLKSPRELETMAHAGRIVGGDAGADAARSCGPGCPPRISTGGRGVHPQPRRRHAVVQGAVRLPQDALHLDQRGDRPRHPVEEAGAPRGEHRQRGRGRALRGAACRLGARPSPWGR